LKPFDWIKGLARHELKSKYICFILPIPKSQKTKIQKKNPKNDLKKLFKNAKKMPKNF